MREEYCFSYAELKQFVFTLLDDYLNFYKIILRKTEERNDTIEQISFPFGKFRAGQRDLAKYCYGIAKNGGRLFVEAPTGIGKTISTLFPFIKAMKDHKYKKAMLLYSQLYRSNPDKPKYLIAQADAEFHMKRYQRVLDLLTPIASRKSIRSMPEEEKNRLRTIFKESAKQMYGISLEPAQEAGE